MARISVTHFTDPGCPWAWSASPALATLRWRYGDQLDWRHVMIGLTEDSSEYEARGYTPLWMATSHLNFRRWGMPFSPVPKARVAGTGRACRAIVAVRREDPAREWAALRALQFLQFTTPEMLDDPEAIAAALGGFDPALIEDAEVWADYERDRADARSAEGTPAEAQGKTAAYGGPVRYTAPSLIFEAEGQRLVAGGWQPYGAYDVLLANLDPTLERRGAPEDLREVLAAFDHGLTTAEVAAIQAKGLGGEPDRVATEKALLELVALEQAVRLPVGDDALWLAPGVEAARDDGGRFGGRRRSDAPPPAVTQR
jgi:protein-disulfide isomerase-like protein with CxxC motif